MLRLSNVEVRYSGGAVLALDDVSLAVPEGQLVTLLGANGAGKSTTLKAISGLLGHQGGRVTRGSIELHGARIDGRDPADIVRLGIFQVMEGRRVFERLTIHDNLLAGAVSRPRQGLEADLEAVYVLFPRLRERRRSLAGYLSGGEQQMLAMARALMARPRVLLLDEPSLGLAPRIVGEIFELIQRIQRESATTILLVEQNAQLALRVAEYAYVLDDGRVVLEGSAAELRGSQSVRDSYLGRRRQGWAA